MRDSRCIYIRGRFITTGLILVCIHQTGHCAESLQGGVTIVQQWGGVSCCRDNRIHCVTSCLVLHCVALLSACDGKHSVSRTATTKRLSWVQLQVDKPAARVVAHRVNNRHSWTTGDPTETKLANSFFSSKHQIWCKRSLSLTLLLRVHVLEFH